VDQERERQDVAVVAGETARAYQDHTIPLHILVCAMTGKEIMAWQDRFYAMPNVYMVEVWDKNDRCYQHSGTYYQTANGAQRECDWHEARGHSAKITSNHMHSDALSTERWTL